MTAQRDRAGEIRGLVLEIRSGLEIGNQMGLALCLHHLYTAM